MAPRQIISNVCMRRIYNKTAGPKMGSIPYPVEGSPIRLLLDNFPRSIRQFPCIHSLTHKITSTLDKREKYGKITLLRLGCPPHSDGALFI